MPEGDAAVLLLDDRLRVLLSLDLPVREAVTDNLKVGAIDLLIAALPKDVDQALLAALIEATDGGEDAVAAAMGDALNQALVVETTP